jgi:hypothetical protein
MLNCPEIALKYFFEKMWFDMKYIVKNRRWRILMSMDYIVFHMVNTNVDIKISVHDAFLEYPSPSTFKVKILDRNIT